MVLGMDRSFPGLRGALFKRGDVLHYSHPATNEQH